MFGAKKNNTKIIEQLEKKCNGLGDILRSIGNTMAVIEFYYRWRYFRGKSKFFNNYEILPFRDQG